MTMLLRAFLAALLTMWIALPTPGSEGGENAGGTGVWILPRATFLCSTAVPSTPPKVEFTVASLQSDLRLQLDSAMGIACGTLIDDVVGQAISLQVAGSLAVVPAATLQSLAGTTAPHATVIIADANHLGYLIRLIVNASTNSCVVRVY